MAIKICFGSEAERTAFKQAHPEVVFKGDIEYYDYTKTPVRIASWCTHYDGMLVTKPAGPPAEETVEFWTARGYTGPEAAELVKWCRANKMSPSPATIEKILAPLRMAPAPVPAAPAETELQKAWREFFEKPDIVKAMGLVPSSVQESFSRVFSGYSIINAAAADPRLGDYVAVGATLAGLTLAAVGVAMALLPAAAGAQATAASGLVNAGAADAGAMVAANAGKIPVSSAILNAAEKAIEGAVVKPVLTKSVMGWATSPAGLKTMVGAAIGLIGTDTFIKFIGEESVQTAGMGVWTLISAKDWKGAKEALEKYRVFIGHLKAEVDAVGYLNPISYGAFKNYYEAAEAQAASYEETINKNLGGPVAGLPEQVRTNVRDIVDGDTISVSMSAYDAKTGSAVSLPEYGTTKHAQVRLVGINAPEKSPKGEIICSDVEIYKVEAKYADASRTRLLPLNEKDVILKIDLARPTDVYGRLLALVEFKGENINLRQVKEGLACGYYPEPNKWVDQALYKSETLKAQANGVGMWAGTQAGPGAPVPFKISITSEPSNAKIYIDNVYTHHLTPSDETELKDVMGMLKPGPHTITVTKSVKGVTNQDSKTINIVSGDNGTLDFTLAPPALGAPAAPAEGEAPAAAAEVFKIYIDSEPSNAKIYVDNVYTHHLTPSDEKELKDVMSLLQPGQHTFMATKQVKGVTHQGVETREITSGDNGTIQLVIGPPALGVPAAAAPAVTLPSIANLTTDQLVQLRNLINATLGTTA